MPLSKDPEKRRRQLENLKPGGGAWPKGATVHLKHGLRTRQPARIVLDPIASEIEDTLAADLPLRGPDGQVPAPDRYMVELAALALLRVRRVSAYLELHGDTDGQGHLRPELDGLGKAIEHAARLLDRLGCSPRARAALGVDLARTADLATAMSEPDPARRADLMAEAGVPIDIDAEEVEDV